MHPGDQGGVVAFVPRGPAGIDNDLVEGCGDTILEPRLWAVVGAADDGELDVVGEKRPQHVAERWALERQEAAGAEPHLVGLRFRRGEEPHADRCTLIDDGGIADDGLSETLGGDAGRQGAEAPRCGAGALQRMATLVDDGPGLLEDVALEHAEVIVLREYIALVDDAEVRS